MATELPRVVGLEELLRLKEPLRERPAPLVYFSDREFKHLTKDAIDLKRLPSRSTPLATFDPWPGGGMVQERCTSPEGQVCFGQWTVGPAGAGVYFDCRCRRPGGGRVPPPPSRPCRLMIDTSAQFQCDGTCELGSCHLGLYRDPSGTVILDCRCRRLVVAR